MSFDIPDSKITALNPLDLYRQLNKDPKFKGLIHPQEPIIEKYYVLKDYKDLSIQLATAGGKTLIGLLIGEWRRIHLQERVLYLTSTRQLANQVANEAESLGISVVVLHGKFLDYLEADCEAYTNCKSIAISNYTSFFNTSTRFKEGSDAYSIGNPQCLICDDAHSADNYVSSQYSIEISRVKYKLLYNQFLDIFKDYFSFDFDETSKVQLIPAVLISENLDRINRVLENNIDVESKKPAELFYPYRNIKNHLYCCLFFISYTRILIRPWISPTWTHQSFKNVNYRLYLSATIGPYNDLERIFGVYPIKSIEFSEKTDLIKGKRMILFVSQILTHVTTKKDKYLSQIINSFDKALLLSPSGEEIKKIKQRGLIKPFNKKIEDNEIEETLAPFQDEKSAILLLTRYDGIDLIGCPMLVFWHAPTAINLQESFLGDTLGEQTIIKTRTLTRIIQGLGRCTRTDNDQTLVLLCGKEFVNVLNKRDIKNFPSQLRVEIEYGLGWSMKNSPQEIITLIDHFKRNSANWQGAVSKILSETTRRKSKGTTSPNNNIQSLENEIEFVKSLWGKAWEGAVNYATNIITDLDDQKKIYRAWWYYFKGHALYLRYKSINQEALLITALECFKLCHQDTLDITPLLLHNFIEKSHIDNLFIPLETEKELIQKRSKALLIGINTYQDDNVNNLSSCIHDVDEIKKILIDPNRCGYSSENVIVLKDATKDKIIYNLKDLSNISGNSTVIIYFSGHGTHKDGKSFLVPSDYQSGKIGTLISEEEFIKSLDRINVHRLVIVLDACKSGGFFTSTTIIKGNDSDLKSGLSENYFNLILKTHGRVIISSSGEEQNSFSGVSGDLSLFTQYFCQGLKGGTMDHRTYDNDGIIRILGLIRYISSNTKEKQDVWLRCNSMDFPIALYKGGK